MRYNIVFATAGLDFNGDTVKTQALGGSETALSYIARYMAEQGHYVRVFCKCSKPGDYDGVFYNDISMFNHFLDYSECDVLIVSRFFQLLAEKKANSKLNVLWNHDTLEDPTSLMSSIWQYDFLYCLTDFHRNNFADKLPELKKHIRLIPNGFDHTIVKRHKTKEHQIMFTSRPERGLWNALNIYEELADPSLRFLICNYKTIDNADVSRIEKQCQLKIDELNAKGFNIVQDRFTKKDLYHELSISKAVLYPTEFPEVYCISALEAMANGTVFVGPDAFALSEVMAYHFDPSKYVSALKEIISDPKVRKNFEKLGIVKAEGYNWERVAIKMVQDFTETFAERSKDVNGVLERLIYESDVELALPMCDEATAKRLRRNMARADYENEATFEQNEYSVLSRVPRLRWYTEKLLEFDCSVAIDYGCHIGAASVIAAKNIPDVELYAFDISKKIIERACDFANDNKAKVHFTSSEETLPRVVDALLAAEVIEHVKDPERFIDHLETFVKPGGKMLITLPKGAWEYMSHHHNTIYHLHGFDFWDIVDMLGGKQDFDIAEYYDGSSRGYYGESVGNYLITYTVNPNNPTGQRDTYRKMLTTRPYQSISACIISKNAKNTIEQTLDDIIFEMDEVIIGLDNKIAIEADFAERVYKYDKVKLFELPDPIMEKGFAQGRNATVSKAAGKWIFWIDTDERLLKQDMFRKYLDSPIVNAYNILQQHPQIDSFLAADKPQRMFRKSAGRFVGCIHEQVQCNDDINEAVYPSLIMTNTHILNFGEIHEKMRRDKAMNRNLRLLELDIKENVDKRIKAGLKPRYLAIVLLIRDFTNRIVYAMEKYGSEAKDIHEFSVPMIKKLYKKYFEIEGVSPFFKNMALTYVLKAMELADDGQKLLCEVGDSKFDTWVSDETAEKIKDLLRTEI